jgi:hypothetical protein
MVTEGNFNFNFPEVFGNFYDYQAAGILHGRLDVPRDVMSGEAFIVHGKTYGYFGPTPALMRIPFVALHLAFGKLSRTFMLLDFVGCLVFSYLILGLMVRMLRGEDAVPSPRSIVLLVSNAGLGSTLFFLGSRAYLHHEAILCGAVFALGSCYYSLRHLAKPAGRAWMAAWAFALLSVNARPTTGLFAFCFLGCAALAVLFRSRAAGAYPARATVRALAIGAACAVGMFSYCLVSYLKFGSFISLPLKDHVQYNPERLARTGGSNFCPSNFAFNVDGYIWTPNIRFWPSFPYMFAAQPNPLDHPEAKMDMVENLLGMPYAMSGLFFLGIGGSVLAMVRRRGLGWVLASVWSAAVPLCMALFTAVAVSQRYTGDFCPLLVVAAAIGLAVYEERRPGAAARTAIVMLTFWSILATLALTFDFGDAVWGVPPEAHARYQRLRSNMNHLLNFHSDAPRP